MFPQIFEVDVLALDLRSMPTTDDRSRCSSDSQLAEFAGADDRRLIGNHANQRSANERLSPRQLMGKTYYGSTWISWMIRTRFMKFKNGSAMLVSVVNCFSML